MNFLEFISSITNSLAWPITLVILVILLKEPTSKLLPLLKHFKYKDLEVRFGEEIQELKKHPINKDTLKNKKPNPLEENYIALQSLETLKERLLELASISPVAAIMDAWIMLEAELINVAYRLDVIDREYPHKIRPREILEKLKAIGHLDEPKYEQVLKLLELRNMVAHSKEQDLKKSDVIEYCELAYSWICYWRGYCAGFSEMTDKE